MHAPVWYANINAVEWITPPPLALGTRLAFVASFRLVTPFLSVAVRAANRKDLARLKQILETDGWTRVRA